MMDNDDSATLREMQQEIISHADASLGEMADRLLWLRDKLRFEDAEWYDDFTQHVATLDSASTFHPTNESEKHQLDAAVKHAIQRTSSLISSKLS